MAHLLHAGIAVSTDGTTWYRLTDDNRSPIKINFEVIEKTSRMADGTLRRYVVARKHKISMSWQAITSLSTQTSDYVAGTSGYAGAWLRSFYEANVFVPVKVKLIISKVTTSNDPTYGAFVVDDNTYKSAFYIDKTGGVPDQYDTYITNFDYEVLKRSSTHDIVNMTLEFTEI